MSATQKGNLTVSTVEMPELLNFVAIGQQAQVIHRDKSKWLLDAINDQLADSAAKSVRYRKNSTINIQIKLIPGQMNQMTVEAKLDVVEPKPDILPLLAYTDSRGRLYGEDPSQTKLPLENTVEYRRKDIDV